MTSAKILYVIATLVIVQRKIHASVVYNGMGSNVVFFN
jgi:hypothetical protein